MDTVSFNRACDYVGLRPTKRQARKFANRRGLAYRVAVKGLVEIPTDVVRAEDRRKIADDLMSRVRK